MPRWRYAPWRRYVMQAVMWVILGATVALAALVTSEAHRKSRVQLNDPQAFGDISIRLPAKWKARMRAEGNPRIIVQASEPDTAPRKRVLTIFRDRADEPLSPLQYLARNFSIDRGEGESHWTQPSAQSIGGWPGVIVSTVSPLSAPGSAPPRVQFLACTVLPSRNVIVVKLDGAGPSDFSDADAVRTICQEMRLAAEPALGHAGEPLELFGEIKLITPDGFVPVANNDASRIDRRLWFSAQSQSASPAAWSAIDLVPRLLDLREPRREQIYAGFSTILATRDPAWRAAKVSEDPPGRLRAQLDRGEVSMRAYLLAGPNGRALLAIFHGAADEAVWNQICSTTTFTAANDIDTLLAAGAEEVTRIRTIGLEKLAGDAREDQWWIWTDQSSAPHLGWTHVEWEFKGFSCRREMRLRRSEHRIVNVTDAWHCDDGMTEYHADVTRLEGTTSPPDRGSETIAQHTQVANGKISISISRGRTMFQPAPPQYVPGGILPMLIGKLSDRPMILRTESFPGFDALAAPTLLTLIIRPATDNPRTVEGETKPMRCLSVHVNGSGQISRWYLRENGDLECVDFPDGVQLLRSDSSSIQFTFHQDSLMMP